MDGGWPQPWPCHGNINTGNSTNLKSNYSWTSLFRTWIIRNPLYCEVKLIPLRLTHSVLTRLFRIYFHVPWDFEIAGFDCVLRSQKLKSFPMLWSVPGDSSLIQFPFSAWWRGICNKSTDFVAIFEVCLFFFNQSRQTTGWKSPTPFHWSCTFTIFWKIASKHTTYFTLSSLIIGRVETTAEVRGIQDSDLQGGPTTGLDQQKVKRVQLQTITHTWARTVHATSTAKGGLEIKMNHFITKHDIKFYNVQQPTVSTGQY